MASNKLDSLRLSQGQWSISVAIVLAAALLLPAAGGHAGNLLPNPGFERVDVEGMPVGWYTSTSALDSAVTTRVAHDGYKSRNCLLMETEEHLTILNVYAPPVEMSEIGSNKILFTCYYRTEGLPGAQMSLITFAQDFYINEWQSRPLQAEAKDIPSSDEWSLLSWQFEALPGGRQVIPLIRITGPGKLYVDNVALRPYPDEISATLTHCGVLRELPDKRRTTVHLTNYTSQRRELQVVLIAVAGEDNAKRMQHTVQIKPNGTGMLHLDYDLPVDIPHSLQLVVRDADSGAVYEHTQSLAPPLLKARFIKPAFRNTLLSTIPAEKLEIAGQINALPAVAQRFRLSAEISEIGLKVTEPSDSIARAGPADFVITLPLAELLSDEYAVIITASMNDGHTEHSLRLPLRKLVPSASEVGYDHHQRLWVNGTPMLARGLYYVCNQEDLSAIASAGFNFAVVPSTRASYAFAKEARKHNMPILISSPRQGAETWENLERKFGQDPALLGWYVLPRPDKQTTPPEVAASVCRQLRSISPRHPTLMALASPSLLRYYSDFPDIVAAWSLPIPTAPITCVARMVDAAVEATTDLHPVWAVIQAAGAAWYDDDNLDPDTSGRAPTPAEVRAMTYLALVHGATGLIYYGYDIPSFPGTKAFKLPEDAPELWTELSTINQQLRWLAPVILQGERRLLPPVSGGELHLATWQYQGSDYIIAVNTANSAVVAEFSLPETEGQRLYAMFEHRWLTPSEDRFQDSFAPHQVHIYSTR